MNREFDNNKVTLSGEIVSNFEFSHEFYGEGFYVAKIESERMSGLKDVVPIMVSDRLVDTGADWIGRFVKASGQFRSYNRHEGKKIRLDLSVFVREFEDVTKEKESLGFSDDDEIFLDGYICKQPTYRETPRGREIADILLAINRSYGKSDYIPCICWGRNARFASSLTIGSHIQICGRIQSREYAKKISETETEKRIAHEVSAGTLEVVEDEQNEY